MQMIQFKTPNLNPSNLRQHEVNKEATVAQDSHANHMFRVARAFREASLYQKACLLQRSIKP